MVDASKSRIVRELADATGVPATDVEKILNELGFEQTMEAAKRSISEVQIQELSKGQVIVAVRPAINTLVV